MKKLLEVSYKAIIMFSFIVFFFIVNSSSLTAMELDLTAAQDRVGKRFAVKFCEAKEQGFNSELSSEFALNNTYFKFVVFPDDPKFVGDLWLFTIQKIREDCGNYLTEKEEKNLKEFFVEEGQIASNRKLYLPN